MKKILYLLLLSCLSLSAQQSWFVVSNNQSKYINPTNILWEGDSFASGMNGYLYAGDNSGALQGITNLTITSFKDSAVWGNTIPMVLTRINRMTGTTDYKLCGVICGHNDCSVLYYAGVSDDSVKHYADYYLNLLYTTLKSKTHFVELYYSTIPKYRSPDPADYQDSLFNIEIRKLASLHNDIHLITGEVILDGTLKSYYGDVVHPSIVGTKLWAGAFANEINKIRGNNVISTISGYEVGTYNNKIIKATASRFIYKHIPTMSDFSISNSRASLTSFYIDTVGHLFFTLNQEPLYTESSITISYTPSSLPLKDIYLNNFPSLSSVSVTNNLKNNTAPLFRRAEIGSFSKRVVFITYNENLDLTKVPATTDYTVTGIATSPTITSVSLVDSTVRLQLSDSAVYTDNVHFTYTSGTNKIQDTGGNISSNLGSTAVTNNVDNGFQYETNQLINSMVSKPTSTDQTHINIFIKYLKDNGLWVKLDRLYVYAAHTNANGEALLDWIHPSTISASGTSINFTAYQGISSYINMNYIPSTQGVHFTLNSASYGYYRRTVVAGFWDNGANKTGMACKISYNSGATQTSYAINAGTGGTVTALGQNIAGVHVLTRRSSTSIIFSINGTEYSTSSTSVSLIDIGLAIGGTNNNGTPSSNGGGGRISMAFTGAALSSTDITNLTTGFEALMDYYGTGILP